LEVTLSPAKLFSKPLLPQRITTASHSSIAPSRKKTRDPTSGTKRYVDRLSKEWIGLNLKIKNLALCCFQARSTASRRFNTPDRLPTTPNKQSRSIKTFTTNIPQLLPSQSNDVVSLCAKPWMYYMYKTWNAISLRLYRATSSKFTVARTGCRRIRGGPIREESQQPHPSTEYA